MIGAFSFSNVEIFLKFSKLMIKNNDKINNEFYLDTVVKNCFKKKISTDFFLVDKFFCWGTPQDYENYLNKSQ